MKRTCLLIVTLMLALGVFSALNAAVSTYVFSQSMGTFTEISGGTVLGTTTTDDQRFVNPAIPLGGTTTTGEGFPIGFDFTLDGNTFDRFAVNYNGWISLGQSALTPSVNITSSSSYPAPLNSTTVLTPAYLRTRIAGFAQDLQGQTGSELSYLTIGTAPERILVVQWKGVKRYGSSNTSNINFQIRLYEGLNKVEVIYGGMTNNYVLTTWAAQVGLGGSGQADYNNRFSTTDWTATTPGASAASLISYSSTIYPPSGLTFAWAMPSGPPVFAVNPTSWDFGTVLLNQTVYRTFILSNSGGGTVTINSVTPSGMYYDISAQPVDLVLSSGESTPFTVSFTPLAYGGPFVGSITVDYDTSAKVDFVIDLTGTCPDPTILLPMMENFTGLVPGTIPFGWARNYGNWGALGTALAGGTSPEMRMYWTPSVTDEVWLMTPPLQGIAGENYRLSFKQFIDYFAVPATYKVQYSLDGLAWDDLWSVVDPTGNIGPETVDVDFVATAATFYLAWVFDGYTYNTDSWYIDDIVLDIAPEEIILDGVTPPPPGFAVNPGCPSFNNGPDTGLPWQGWTITGVGIADVIVYNQYPTSPWWCWINVGGMWMEAMNPISDPSYTFVDVNFDTKGPVYIIVNDNSTLPVELSGFFATLTAQNFVKLTWISQSETGLLGYRVYRNESNDQAGALMITQMVPATNTSTTQTYSVTDSEVLIGSTYWYWLESVDYNHSDFHGPVSVTVEGNVPPVLPETTTLRSAYPNPFNANSSVNIGVEIKAGDSGTVTIYNLLGQVVKTFSVSEGIHNINWNGKDSKGNACGSGIYFYKLSTPSMNQTRKMVIVK